MIRLSSDDLGVQLIGTEAVNTIRSDPRAAAALFSRLWNLHLRRERMIARRATVSTSAVPPRMSGTGYRTLWGTLLGIGVTGALVQAVMFGPADRKNSFTTPETAVSVAIVAGMIAIVALLGTLILRVPDRASARCGEVLSVMVGIISIGILSFRLAAGVSDGRGFLEHDLAEWQAMTGVSVLLLVCITVRTDLARRRSATRSIGARGHSRTSEIRQLRREAEQLASSGRQDQQAAAQWLSRLDTLDARGIDPVGIDQARKMTPTEWLTWLAYDGEIAISTVIPRP